MFVFSVCDMCLLALCLLMLSSSASMKVGSRLQTPRSVQAMMQSAGESVRRVKEDRSNQGVCLIDIPVPVTGGTELDDWPGGIKQKYSVLLPMLVEMMTSLNFTESEISSRNFVGSYGEDDAVGIWRDNGYTICCFPNADSISTLAAGRESGGNGDDLLVLVNEQLFMGQNLGENLDSRSIVESGTMAYQLEQLNMRGPSLLPVRGLLYRKFPGPFVASRRLDDGEQVVLATYESTPTRVMLEELFFEDSAERDKDMTLLNRIKKQIPAF